MKILFTLFYLKRINHLSVLLNTGITYWFKCTDLDGNGVLTRNELQFFYEEQLHRMECMAEEPVHFEDILCQIVDMEEAYFTLQDLKGSKLSGSTFNILFNLNKFMAFESRDPFLIRQRTPTVVHLLHMTKGIYQAMDRKSWPWKKTSIEKTMIPADRVNISEDEENLTNTVEQKTNLKLSDENLSTVKDDIITKKQTTIAREAIQGWEKAETEVLALKQELEKATQQREILNECMLQLRFVCEEQEQKIHAAASFSIKTRTRENRSFIQL